MISQHATAGTSRQPEDRRRVWEGGTFMNRCLICGHDARQCSHEPLEREDAARAYAAAQIEDVKPNARSFWWYAGRMAIIAIMIAAGVLALWVVAIANGEVYR